MPVGMGLRLESLSTGSEPASTAVSDSGDTILDISPSVENRPGPAPGFESSWTTWAISCFLGARLSNHGDDYTPLTGLMALYRSGTDDRQMRMPLRGRRRGRGGR